ncbi:MAG: stage V sporulation protein AD, partial [Oscillospiraceae bacterium]|nr:stage V sporulation protein AD [Oscillospiraceae bacterium]
NDQIDMLFAGDLLNQCVGSSFCLRDTGIPFLGLYGACSTMAESLLLAGIAIDGEYASRAAAMTSSHFAGAERQYRFPLSYGGQRTPTAQWTVTGAGCLLLRKNPGGKGPYLSSATIGRIVDLGVKDANNMGAAMAPAAYDTILAHFRDLSLRPEDYDLIVTGDLGETGSRILCDLFHKDGIELKKRHFDCGCAIFDAKRQDVHAGGSGCGCSASTLCGYLLRQMQAGRYHRILFCATGALLSPLSTQQGESVPGVCHAVAIHAEGY